MVLKRKQMNDRAERVLGCYRVRIFNGDYDFIKCVEDVYHVNVIHYLGCLVPEFKDLVARECSYGCKHHENMAYRSCKTVMNWPNGGLYLLLMYLNQFIPEAEQRKVSLQWIERTHRPVLTFLPAEVFACGVDMIILGAIVSFDLLRKETNWVRRVSAACCVDAINSMVAAIKPLRLVTKDDIPNAAQRRPHVGFVRIAYARRLMRQVVSFI